MKLKPSIQIGHGSGQPAGFPDFKPINAWGNLPTRKRAMPSPREFKAPETDLYQLWVEDRKGLPIAIGPKAPRQFLEPLLVAINGQISLGNEHDFSNPHLEQVGSILVGHA